VSTRDPFRFRSVIELASRSRARKPARMIQFIALESQRSRLPQMAAALSYRTVFGLLPMVIVALVALRFFVSDAQIDQFFNRALSYAGLESIVLTSDESAFWTEEELKTARENNPDAPPKPDAGDTPGPVGTKANPAPPEKASVSAAEETTNELGATIRSLILRAKKIDYRAIGIIGAITLIYAAISMLTEVERSFNQIFRVPIGKPWRRRLTEYWALLTLGTPCLVATFYVGERAKSIIEHTVESAGLSSSGTIGLFLSGYAITVLISAALLLLMYTILPNTRVRLVPALAGALLAAILWEAGKWGFTQYLRFSTSYAKLYGSIALIPIFLLWIYATWAIVLLGLHVTYHVQKMRDKKDPDAPPVSWTLPPAGVVDPGVAVAIVHAAARGFQTGRSASLVSMVEAARAQGSVVLEMVQRLVDANILNRVAGSNDPFAVSLAMPPEKISVRRVLEQGYDAAGAADAATHPAGDAGNAPSVGPDVRERMREAHLDAAGTLTIADLLRPPLADPPSIPLAGPPSGDPKAPRSETWDEPGANSYAPASPGDTLGTDAPGAPAREPEIDPVPRPEHDRPLRAGRSPGLL
jgi:membrane protein